MHFSNCQITSNTAVRAPRIDAEQSHGLESLMSGWWWMGRRMVVAPALAACLASGVQLTDRLLIESRPAGWRMMRGALSFCKSAALCLALRWWWVVQGVSTMPRGVELVEDWTPRGVPPTDCRLSSFLSSRLLRRGVAPTLEAAGRCTSPIARSRLTRR